MTDAIKTQYTTEVTCPGCGHEHSDSWEMSDDDDHECESCGIAYGHTRHVVVEYCTSPACPTCKRSTSHIESYSADHVDSEDRWRCRKCKVVMRIVKDGDNAKLEVCQP